MNRAALHSRSGFSALELAFALAIFSLVAGAAVAILVSTNKAKQTSTAMSELGAQVSRSVSRLAWALTPCAPSVFDPAPAAPASTSTLSFQQPQGQVGGSVVWGPVERIELQLDPGEVLDGIDNDGDGLADEGRVVWFRNAGLADEQSFVLCHDVRRFLEGEVGNGLDDNGNGLIDEPGLSFDVAGDRVTIRLTLERVDRAGLVITRTSETAVRARNPSS